MSKSIATDANQIKRRAANGAPLSLRALRLAAACQAMVAGDVEESDAAERELAQLPLRPPRLTWLLYEHTFVPIRRKRDADLRFIQLLHRVERLRFEHILGYRPRTRSTSQVTVARHTPGTGADS